MNYFVIQIKTKQEKIFLNTAKQKEKLNNVSLLWLKKTNRIRKCGNWKEEIVSIFPGYLFVSTDYITNEIFMALKQIPGFIKFLRDNNVILPLSDHDCEIISHFLSFGMVMGKSQVVYDKDMRVRVVSGPLKDLEGNIVKVDRRKKKAKVLVNLCRNSFYINMDFEVISVVNSEKKDSKKLILQ